ncbi:MAG: fatty acid desaturase [Rhodospirillaceae bacterium]|nr:fatty acid desaturase [Rhodospirillales bacterium]
MAASEPALATREMLQILARRSNGHAALRVASHMGAIGLVGLLIWWIVAEVGAVWAVPLLIAQGWLVGFLFMPLHETAHKTAFESRLANVVVGNICAAAVVLPYEYYTLFHWAHHRHTQDPERDPELVAATPVPATVSGLGIWFLGVRQLLGRTRLLLRHAVTGRVIAPWVPAGKRALVVREARVLVATYATFLIASIALETTILLWVWLAPLIIGQAFLRPYLLAEHSGCGHSRDAFENTRTTFTSGVVRWFTWNMPYHAEHHAHPNIPFHALPLLHAVVEGRLVHRGEGYRAVTRQVWRWFRQRQT